MAARQTASKTEKSPVEIKLAHSPDSDDAFMFYALATHKLPTPGYKYTHVLADIQSLNDAALTETYDVTAISFAAYPALRDKYILLDCGASFGEGYGPIVVSTKALKPTELAGNPFGIVHGGVYGVIDGRPELLQEVRAAPDDLRAYLALELFALLRDSRFIDAVPGHLLPDAASQSRIPMLLRRIEELTQR